MLAQSPLEQEHARELGLLPTMSATTFTRIYKYSDYFRIVNLPETKIEYQLS